MSKTNTVPVLKEVKLKSEGVKWNELRIIGHCLHFKLLTLNIWLL